MFLKALFDPRIQWKNGFYRLKWGGLAEVIKAPSDCEYALPVMVTSDQLKSKSLLMETDEQTVFRDHDDCRDGVIGKMSSDVRSLPGDSGDSGDSSMENLSSSKKSFAYRIRHFRSQSLPQKMTFMSLINNFSNKLGGANSWNGSVQSACDDIVTGNFPFRSKTDRYDLL